jgi:hypothetical protein
MKRYGPIKSDRTRKHLVVGQPMNTTAISFDDLYEDISDHWLEKSRRLQARRWRKIKHQIA